MNFREMNEAVKDAEFTVCQADRVSGEMARLIVGRLRKSSASMWVLESLKRELKDYNIQTGCWKDK